MKLIPRTDEALSFLQRWCEAGPWVLTAISPTTGAIVTKTFGAEELKETEAWIAERNGKWNLYFTINRVVSYFSSKPKKPDISSIVTWQVDIDPRVGEDFNEERVRILKRLQEFKPAPSVIVDSGGGYQGFWLLEEPIVLDGSEAMAEEYERYSIQLELLLAADPCHNCDRIFRLPGTINLPNEKKKKKGRVAALSSVVEWGEIRYKPTDFTKAPGKVQYSSTPGSETLAGGGEKVQISGNIRPLYIDDLPKKNINLPDFAKVLIVQGHNPDNVHQYPSRSEALWAATCALVRAGADDETIAGILLNKDNRISESVLDKPRPERYAAKQIQDAKEEIEDPVLREFNSKHCVISDIAGRCRIISEVFEYTLGRARISQQSFQDFVNRYSHRRVQIATDKDGKPIMKQAGKWWIENANRRQYDTIVFAPGRDIPQAYNLWRGFACEAIPGNFSLFLTHIEQNLCQGNKEYFNYLMGWMARCVQQPDCPGEVAIVLRGDMGTGKGTFCKHFGSLFGRHFLQVSDPKHLVGSFNSHLRDCVLLFGDEAFWAGDKKHESVLKALVTESTIAVESKGVDVVSCPNYTHIILASNSAWVVPAGSNERRFFVLDVGDGEMQNKKYFSAIQAQMNSGGREALLHYLLTYDISNFEVREVPKTSALQEQKVLSMENDEAWWYEKLEEGRLLKEHDTWEREIMKDSLQDNYITFMQRIGIMRKSSPTVLGKFLSKVCPKGSVKSYQRMANVKILGSFGEEMMVNRRTYFYELPTLEACRAHWDAKHGGPFNWPIPLEKEVQLEIHSPEDGFA